MYFTTSLLPKVYQKECDNLKADMKLLPDRSVAITHDGWTSIATESYNTVTAHYIDISWELISKVLNTRLVTGHTGEEIFKDIK